MGNKHHEDFWVTVANQMEVMPPSVAQMIGVEKLVERLPESDRLDYVKLHALAWKMETRDFTMDDMEHRRLLQGQTKLGPDVGAIEIVIQALLPQTRAVEFRMLFDG